MLLFVYDDEDDTQDVAIVSCCSLGWPSLCARVAEVNNTKRGAIKKARRAREGKTDVSTVDWALALSPMLGF